MVFALLKHATEELWTFDSLGTRVLAAEDIAKYKVCSASNGAGVDFVPYTSIDFSGSQKDKGIHGFIAVKSGSAHQIDYSDVNLCSNPTW